MKIIVAFFLIIFSAFGVLEAQTNFNQTVDSVLLMSGLNRNDVSLPFFSNEDNEDFSNHKLLIGQVKESLLNPLNSVSFTDKLKELKNENFYGVLNFLFKILNDKLSVKKDIINPKNYFKELCGFIVRNRIERENLLGVINETDLNYLKINVLEVVLNPGNNSDAATDIFKFNQARDSGLIKTNKIVDLLSKIDREKYYNNLMSDAYLFYNLYSFVRDNPEFFLNLKYEKLNNKNLQGSFSILNYSGLKIVIGDNSRNIYRGDFDIIIDLGGNDIYELDNPGKQSQCWIIDLSGDDYYSGLSDYSIAGSLFSSSFILDADGNDIYKGNNVSLGSAIAGISALIDLKGDDYYMGKFLTCGSGFFGVGLLYDNDGNDVYTSMGYSQGFGLTQGIGMIYDNKGNDNYIIKSQVLDVTRYEDHFESMSQGFGLGFRPYYAGGIGIIFDCSGNDLYSSDIFGQGSAYWFSSGYLIDLEGNDKYTSYQYSQGAGIHFATGYLLDYSGNDNYTANGTSQGCGHDYGFGLLLDNSGDDNYSANSLSQGAGNANGIGILVDLSGKDGYLNKQPSISRGYGNFRRETVSLGLFIDAAGVDYYSKEGPDSNFLTQSDYGVFADLSNEEENINFNVKQFFIPFIDKEYTTDELVIMAKTIEPRFSEWQKSGFNRLVSDSIHSDILLKYLESDDARIKLVLDNLMFKIGNTFSAKLANFVPEIIKSPLSDNQKENTLSFICYLMGEYGDDAYTDLLLSLSDYKSIIVKSSAVYALGKIKNPDTNKKQAVIKKLSELKKIKTDYISFYKDIVICLGKYVSEFSYFALLDFLNSEYHYSIRIPASRILKNYNKDFSYLIDKDIVEKISMEQTSMYWFINSLTDVNEKEFYRILGLIDSGPFINNANIRNKIASVIKERLKNGLY